MEMVLSSERLNVLVVTPMAPSPPRFGAQARTHGLLSELAQRHDLTAVVLHDDADTPEVNGPAMRAYCKEVLFVRNPNGTKGWRRRALQARSWLSGRSFQRHLFTVAEMQDVLDRVLRSRRFDVVFVNFPHLAHYNFRQAPPGSPLPAVVIDSHDINYDLARQVANSRAPFAQRLHARLNWRKLAREELTAYETADGVCVCSEADQKRLADDSPTARTIVVPNAADVERLRPLESDPAADGRTVLFFGLLSTIPNVDGVVYFLREVWPKISSVWKDAQFAIVGANPAPAIRSYAGPNVAVVGQVDDLRPYLASAAVVVVPLRLGSGTRLKILEAWAMAKPVVSTSLGAEGLSAVPGRDLLIADDPATFADSVVRVLADQELARRVGLAGRELVSSTYSWEGVARSLGDFLSQAAARRRAQQSDNRGSKN